MTNKQRMGLMLMVGVVIGVVASLAGVTMPAMLAIFFGGTLCGRLAGGFKRLTKADAAKWIR